jgi:hypothetical protein
MKTNIQLLREILEGVEIEIAKAVPKLIQKREYILREIRRLQRIERIAETEERMRGPQR